jgi:1-phosphatidylinositol-3-phosphate 5-kinase
LKGSTRNRHVQSTGRENEVLLDENLLESKWPQRAFQADIDLRIGSQLSPIYMREPSKRILRGALYNDSKFLADLNVMDYSLVMGVDNKSNELVVGIVGECYS